MITRHTFGSVTWLDLESPDRDEVMEVMEEFGIDERIEQEIASATSYPLSIAFPGYSYLVLHFPVTGSEDGARVQEVDFIIGKSFLITVRYESIDALYNLHRVLEAEELLGTSKKLKPDAVLVRVMHGLYGAISSEAELAGAKLERVERDIFTGRERQAVRKISESARVLLRFETALARHAEPLADFLAMLGSPAFFGTRFDEYAVRIEAEHAHAASVVASYRAIASELRKTNDSLLTSSQSRVIQTLTVFSFVSYPPLLIAAIFAMDTTEGMPFVGHENGFWIVIGLMLAAILAFLAVAKKNRWL
ncbi:MAG: Magnesium and cobalt transport protein CorA [Parcubacteria bacterium C7867-004]|nr:MAG: Magnesium and cobalt transport protein CorA [Parcubacteria bacterium C7867-004]